MGNEKGDPANKAWRGRTISWIRNGASCFARNRIRGSVGVFVDEPEAQAYFTRDVRVVSAQDLQEIHRCTSGASKVPVTS
jgi:hypothetical protein